MNGGSFTPEEIREDQMQDSDRYEIQELYNATMSSTGSAGLPVDIVDLERIVQM
jgi:hypothetical protein